MQGHEIIVADNFFTGRKRNVEHWLGHENFELIHHDIVNPLFIEVDEIYHLASPASPPHYMYNPVKTIKTNTVGTINVLGLAKRVGAKVLIASTSEVYGDPTVHPQPETYWGHVNPVSKYIQQCSDSETRDILTTPSQWIFFSTSKSSLRSRCDCEIEENSNLAKYLYCEVFLLLEDYFIESFFLCVCIYFRSDWAACLLRRR